MEIKGRTSRLTLAEAIDAMKGDRSALLEQIGRRLIAFLGLLAVGIAMPGPIGMTALCLAAMAMMAWHWSMADYVAGGWFLTLLELQRIAAEEEDAVDPAP